MPVAASVRTQRQWQRLRAPWVLVVLGLAMPAVADVHVLAAQDKLAAAREALAAGRLENAAAALTESGIEAPGLAGTIAERRGDLAAACAVYKADRTSPRGPAADVRWARCLTARGDVAGARAAWAEVAHGPFATDVRILDEMGAFLEAHALPVDALTGALALSVRAFDHDGRAALSRTLLRLATSAGPTVAERAVERLMVEFSDTPAGERARTLPAASGLPADTLKSALRRAQALAERHDSAAVIAVLAPFQLGADDVACEARLLRGKAWRKLRKYAAARRELDAVATECTDDFAKRARYLAARVASLSKRPQAASTLRAFIERWPDDALTDDALLWLGEVLDAAQDVAGAERAWSRGLSQFPTGDQAHELRFRLAWSRARRGDVAGARELLEDAARAGSARMDVADRALYWRARLALCPDITSLDAQRCVTNARQRSTAIDELVAFASQRPASWYGHLARLLVVEDARRHGERPPPLPTLTALRTSAHAATLAPSATLKKSPRFTLAMALVTGGYDEEALRLLQTSETADLPRTHLDDVVAVGLLMAHAGKPGDGHAHVRNAGMSLLPGRPETNTSLAWHVAWPRAHSASIETAAKAQLIPRELLFGLAREESAFDATVVSWAGAVGLCQLMVPTAQDEARALKLPPPQIEALRDPDLNARLGAAHLRRRLDGMGHPMLAIAAYNAGPGGVAQWNPTGPLDAWVEQIPVDETRNYVKKVTGSWVTYATLDGNLDDVTFPLALRSARAR